MVRYINYDELLEKWYDLGFDEISKIHKVNALNHFIKSLPTADVVEVRHGEWIWLEGNLYECSECPSKTEVDEYMNKPLYEYCPYCGAKMEVDKNV